MATNLLLRKVFAWLTAFALVAAPVGLPIGAFAAPTPLAAKADCGGACHCDQAGLDCLAGAACPSPCSFNGSAVIALVAQAFMPEHVPAAAAVQGEATALSIRPPLPPPQR